MAESRETPRLVLRALTLTEALPGSPERAQGEREGDLRPVGQARGETRRPGAGTLWGGALGRDSPLPSHPRTWLIRSVLMDSGEPRTGWRRGWGVTQVGELPHAKRAALAGFPGFSPIGTQDL